MTLRQSLSRYVRGLLEEPPTPRASDPPTPNPESTRPTTTTSSRTNGTSEAGLLTVVLETLERMQKDQQRETRELVLSILQGRPILEGGDQSSAPSSEQQPSKTPYDPVDYDSTDLTDLPTGIQGIFEREEQERTDLRHLRTEQEVLAAQLHEARQMVMDRQGPDFELS